uniref:EF-1-gamma C-terminal domain-containing protein n=1 Tax=Helicotheca tamesis TaxID=374047 RepID=A0A7S2IE41_9STRA
MAEKQDNEASAATTCTPEGASVMKAWKSRYGELENKNDLMESFWSLYDPDCTSIWTMSYDEADSNENLEETIGYVKNLLAQPGMEGVRGDCFCLVHTLESLEIEGIWFFNGPDPEVLFGANPETSWYTFKQMGPAATDGVKQAVTEMMAPADSQLNGKAIKDTQVFC